MNSPIFRCYQMLLRKWSLFIKIIIYKIENRKIKWSYQEKLLFGYFGASIFAQIPERLYFKRKYSRSSCFLHVVHRQRAGPPRARVGINRCWFMTPRQNRGHQHRFRCNLDNWNRFDNPENLNGATIKAPASRRFVYKSGILSADIMRDSTYHEISRDGCRFYTRRIWSTCIFLRDTALIMHAYNNALVIKWMTKQKYKTIITSWRIKLYLTIVLFLVNTRSCTSRTWRKEIRVKLNVRRYR